MSQFHTHTQAAQPQSAQFSQQLIKLNEDLQQGGLDLEVNLSLTELIEIFSAVCSLRGCIPARGCSCRNIFAAIGINDQPRGACGSTLCTAHSRTVAEQLRRRLGMPLKSNIPSELLRALLLLPVPLHSRCLPCLAVLRAPLTVAASSCCPFALLGSANFYQLRNSCH